MRRFIVWIYYYLRSGEIYFIDEIKELIYMCILYILFRIGKIIGLVVIVSNFELFI